MNPNLNVSGNGDARHNNFSSQNNSNITNHIYLQPGSNQSEFDDWMRRIGSLLQVGSGYASLKPALELIAALFEPFRLFVIDHSALSEFDIDSWVEILVVMDESQISSKKPPKGILNMACFKQKNVVIHFETSGIVERGIERAHPHYCTFCTEDNLVLSNSPYRLPKVSDNALSELNQELPQRFEKLFEQTSLFLLEAEQLTKKQSSNLAALMLHQCMEYLYKNILYEYEHKFYKTKRLLRLHPKVKKFLPQVCSQISESTINTLDDTSRWITAPHYDVGEIWDIQNVMEEVTKVLDLTKVTFERRMALFFREAERN